MGRKFGKIPKKMMQIIEKYSWNLLTESQSASVTREISLKWENGRKVLGKNCPMSQC